MATLERSYGSATGVTITLTSLGDTASRQSTEIDNSSVKALDYLVYAKLNGSAAGNTDSVNVYVGGQLGDNLRPAGLGASDAAFSGVVDELAFLDAIPMNGTTSVVVVLRAGVAAAFGGVCPEKFVLVFENQSGAALSSTAGDFDINIQPIKLATA